MLALFAIGCGDTGLARVTFPIHGAGTAPAFEEDGWSVTIERADVAFGPLYLCATPFADTDVCPQAEAEFLGAATIDATDESPQMIGDAGAVTATVRSAMFDYGRTWLLTEERVRDYRDLRGHSAIFEVRADDGTTAIEIRAEVDVDPGNAGQSAVIGAPAGPHEIAGDEALIATIDAAAWWRRVDFDRIAAMGTDVTLAPGDPDYETLVIAMTAGSVPALTWEEP